MSQCPHWFTVCPNDSSLAHHIKQCPVRIQLSACPHIKKQALHCSKTQPTPVQVIVEQQWIATTLRNDTHTASTRYRCSTLADPLPVRDQVFEACCATAPTTAFYHGGYSPDDSIADGSNYHTFF